MLNAWFPVQHMDRPPVEVDGLCYFYFCPVEDVLQWSGINPQTGTITDEIVLKEGKSWLRCNVIEGGRAYTEEQQEDPSGPFLSMKITGFLPGDSPANTYTASAMKYRQFAIVMKERTGIMRLLGNQYAGCDFSQAYTSADINGTRGRSLTFTWQNEDSAPLYLSAVSIDGTIIVPPWHQGGGGTQSGYITKSVQADGVASQSDYTFPELVGNELLLVCVPPVVMYVSELQDQYTYNISTGTIHFNYPLTSEQKMIALYNKPVT